MVTTSIPKGDREKVFEKYQVVETQDLPPRVLCRVVYPICNIGQLNANNRMYERDVWDKVISDPNVSEKLNNRCLYGDAEHPKESQSRLERTAHVVNKMWIDEDTNRVMQEMDVLDTPYGRIIDTLLESGCGVGVSTRAEGELEEALDEAGNKFYRVLPEAYRYITTDFTADPSTSNPYPEEVQRAMVESINKDQKEMDKEFAVAILESLQVDSAKSLCESIKGEGKKDLSEKKITSVRLDESIKGKSDPAFTKCLLAFIDEKWSETREKDFVKLMNEYREHFKVAPKEAIISYLGRLWKTNEKSIQPFVSEKFASDYKALMSEEIGHDDELDDEEVERGEAAEEYNADGSPVVAVKEEPEGDMEGELNGGASKPSTMEGEPVMGEPPIPGIGDIDPNVTGLEMGLDFPTSALMIPTPIIDPRTASVKELANRFGYLDWMTDSGNDTSSPYLKQLEKERLDLLDELSYRWNRTMQESKDKDQKIDFRIDESNVLTGEDVSYGKSVVRFLCQGWDGNAEKKLTSTILENKERILSSSKAETKDYLGRVWESNSSELINNASDEFVDELLELINSPDLDETEEIKKMYQSAGIKAPKGKGIHTKKFHRMAVDVMKGYKKGGLTDKERQIAYATAMKKLGPEKAVKAGHRHSKNESITELIYENYWSLVDFLSGKKSSAPKVKEKEETPKKRPLNQRTEADIIAGRLEEKKVNEEDEHYNDMEGDVNEGTYRFTVNNLHVEIVDENKRYTYEDIEHALGVFIEYGEADVTKQFPNLFVSVDADYIYDLEEGKTKKKGKKVNDSIDLVIKEASIRAERDKALEIIEDLNSKIKGLEGRGSLESKILLAKLKATTSELTEKCDDMLEKYNALKLRLKETFGELKIARAKTDTLVSELDKIKQDKDAMDQTIVSLESDYRTKLEQLEAERTEERKNLLENYVRAVLSDSFDLLPERTRALLVESKTVEQIDERLTSIRQTLREDALHSSSRISENVVTVVQSTIDPMRSKIAHGVDLACTGILGNRSAK
jgi:hypothetical protein